MGASESNAGDAFHFWWAANRALMMLRPGAPLAAIALEGLCRFDDSDEIYETVDLAEYYGGSDARSATRVVLSQLKHSTRHPDTPWTVAALCERRQRAGTASTVRSVAADLAAAYKTFVADFGEERAARVTIALVTNRPPDALMIEAVEKAATWIKAQTDLPRRTDLLKAMRDPHKEVIKKIGVAVGSTLTSRAFCGFIASLDFSNAGSLGHSALARAVTAAAAGLTPGNGPDSARRLFDLVRQEALPNGGRGRLVAEDILAELGLAHAADLYPAPASFAEIDNPIPAASASDLAAALLVACAENGGDKSRVVALGAAGGGKTTTLRQVSDHLPEGSVVVLFDSYGGGEYLDSGLERHLPDRFAIQVINDLSQFCGTPLLVAPPHRESDIWRQFSRSIDAAIATLKPGAVLVLAVDAADNAAVAAQVRQDRSFLPGLSSLRLPERSALLLSARPHRVDLLGMKGATEVPVKPFDSAASREHLLRYRPNAADEAEQFHERTQGNPRVQFYALQRPGVDQMDPQTFLASCASTPNEIFADLLSSAIDVSGAQAGGPKWLAAMLALSRPVALPVLASALAVDEAAVSAFASGLEPGVMIKGDRISFRDEDFETFVRDNVDDDQVTLAHSDLATMFLSLRAEDGDAAAFVVDHLDAAGRFEEVLDLVLSEVRPVGISDGFRREQVQARRLDLAARAAVAVDDPSIAVRLASRGCDTASRFDTLDRLVEQRFDLVARYADVELFRGHALKQTHADWKAPTLLRVAAALSRTPSQEAGAWEALAAADAWMRRWIVDNNDETRYWRIEPADIAASLEARYRLGGAGDIVAELKRWRPDGALLEASAEFAERLAIPATPGLSGNWISDLQRAMVDAGVPARLQAPFVARLRPAVNSSIDTDGAQGPTASDEASGQAPRPRVEFEAQWTAWVIQVAVDLIDAIEVTTKHKSSDHPEEEGVERADAAGRPFPWLLDLVQVLASLGEVALAGRLAERSAERISTHPWEFAGITSRGFRQVQTYAFASVAAGEELQATDLLPHSLRPPVAAAVDEGDAVGQPRASSQVADPRKSDREEWLSAVEGLLQPAVVAARAASGSATAADVSEWVEDLLNRNADAASRRWFKANREFGPVAALAIDAIGWSAAPTHLIFDLASATIQAVGSEAPSLMLLLAERAARNGVDGDVVVEICLHAVDELERGDHSAADRLDIIGGAAEIVARFEESEGRELFEKAVAVATGINDDAALLLGVHVELSGRADVPAADAPRAARDLVAAAVGIARYASDPRYVPYNDVAAAATRLDAITGLQAVSRWDDQDRTTISSAMPGVLVAAVRNGTLTPGQAACFDHFVEQDGARLNLSLDLCELMLAGGASGRTDARLMLGRTCAWLRRRVPGRDQHSLAKRLVQWATERGVANSVPADVKSIATLSIVRESREQSAYTPAPLKGGADNIGPEITPESWRSLPADVETLNDGSAYGEEVRHHVFEVLAAARRSDRLAALNVVFTLPDRHASSALAAAAQAIRSWGGPAKVKVWASTALPSMLVDWLGSLAWRADTALFVEDLRAFTDDDGIRRALLAALPVARTELSSHGWRNLTQVFGHLCPPAAASDALLGLLQDGIAVREAALTGGSADERFARTGETERPEGPNVIASFLWSAFGHPRRAVRWRAAHAVRDLLSSQRDAEIAPIAAALIACLDRRNIDEGGAASADSGWRDPSLVFYWMSAAVGVMVALERVADEKPAVLRPHLDDLVRHATSVGFPHVQVRELASRAAHSVIAQEPVTAANRDRLVSASERLWGANRPRSCRVARVSPRGLNDRRVSDTIRYQFDAMDTLPYWYAPLARVFDISLDAVTEPAERWIVDLWGFDHDDWWQDERELRDESSYSRMGHRQGSIPPEESLRLYVEYHAMMVAAGELVDSGAPVAAQEWDESDSWESWLYRYLTRPGAWTSDFASDVPNRPDLFGLVEAGRADSTPGAGEATKEAEVANPDEALEPSDFNDVLELADGSALIPEDLIVYKRMKVDKAKEDSHFHVSSALASPPHALDLQRALAAASNPMDWKLPEENEETFEIVEPDYELRGWIADREDQREGLDEHDPYAAGLTACVNLPGQEFVETTSATLGDDGMTLVSPAGKTVAQVEQWADSELPSEYTRAVVTSGEILRVPRDALLVHLGRVNKVLILEVQIDRHVEGRRGEYKPPKNRIYLVDQEGRISGS